MVFQPERSLEHLGAQKWSFSRNVRWSTWEHTKREAGNGLSAGTFAGAPGSTPNVREEMVFQPERSLEHLGAHRRKERT